jgi:DNA-binding protein HU-beta
MTKKELVLELARARGIKPDQARAFVDILIGSIERALSEGQPVTIRSFGRFDLQPRARRSMRIPGKTEPAEIPARLTPVFRGSPGLTRRVTEGRGTSSISGGKTRGTASGR